MKMKFYECPVCNKQYGFEKAIEFDKSFYCDDCSLVLSKFNLQAKGDNNKYMKMYYDCCYFANVMVFAGIIVGIATNNLLTFFMFAVFALFIFLFGLLMKNMVSVKDF